MFLYHLMIIGLSINKKSLLLRHNCIIIVNTYLIWYYLTKVTTELTTERILCVLHETFSNFINIIRCRETHGQKCIEIISTNIITIVQYHC